MDIVYLGHSAFKLKGKEASVVTDPYEKKSVGFAMSQVSADIVTVSHEHDDHNAVNLVSGTSRRQEPYVIRAPGEYEASGIGVFGWGTYHDNVQGQNLGKNTIYSIVVDGIRLVHLGDLGHILSEAVIEGIGTVDVLCVPVSGVTSLNVKEAMTVIEQLSPSIVIPMHYVTDEHNPPEKFAGKSRVDEFLKEMGVSELEPVDKLKVTPESLPETATVVRLKRS